ncbi:hypothetical protein LINGRAHAP2_LOCUS17551, partial [Linum grandiflorum]
CKTHRRFSILYSPAFQWTVDVVKIPTVPTETQSEIGRERYVCIKFLGSGWHQGYMACIIFSLLCFPFLSMIG